MSSIVTRQSKPLLLACNVYISAGSASDAPWLLRLLQSAQDYCRSHTGTVVHAFSDVVYRRSSFHVAGTPSTVVGVTCLLATLARNALLQSPSLTAPREDTRVTPHPTVGAVDHIAVLPLSRDDDDGDDDNGESAKLDWSWDDWQSHIDSNKNEYYSFLEHPPPPLSSTSATISTTTTTTTTPAGWTARAIGHVLQTQNDDMTVHFYGHAHPDKLPLPVIRRTQTTFFQQQQQQQQQQSTMMEDVSVVGAPRHFVENYNIRLTCSKATARTLTQQLCQHVPYVEALTLPYGNNVGDCWEVACNLTHPAVTSVQQAQAQVQAWERAQSSSSSKPLVETCYRVGTTAQQCREVLDRVVLGKRNDVDPRRIHDPEVQDKFRHFLLSNAAEQLGNQKLPSWERGPIDR